MRWDVRDGVVRLEATVVDGGSILARPRGRKWFDAIQVELGIFEV